MDMLQIGTLLLLGKLVEAVLSVFLRGENVLLPNSISSRGEDPGWIRTEGIVQTSQTFINKHDPMDSF